MNLVEYMKKVLSTTEQDWTVNVCWGAGSGPSFYDRFTVWNTGKGDFQNIEIDSHSTIASLKTDLSISMAWGMTHNDDFYEDWSSKFPDPKASSSYIDFFYNGVLVYRDIYVSIDGGRCYIPLPDMQFNGSTHKLEKFTVPIEKFNFFRLINSVTSSYDYDRYFTMTGIEISNESWPK